MPTAFAESLNVKHSLFQSFTGCVRAAGAREPIGTSQPRTPCGQAVPVDSPASEPATGTSRLQRGIKGHSGWCRVARSQRSWARRYCPCGVSCVSKWVSFGILIYIPPPKTCTNSRLVPSVPGIKQLAKLYKLINKLCFCFVISFPPFLRRLWAFPCS